MPHINGRFDAIRKIRSTASMELRGIRPVARIKAVMTPAATDNNEAKFSHSLCDMALSTEAAGTDYTADGSNIAAICSAAAAACTRSSGTAVLSHSCGLRSVPTTNKSDTGCPSLPIA